MANQNGRITTEGNITTRKVSPTMYCLCNCNGKERDKKIKKKKEITCFRCKKTGHYSNECEEELPKTNHEKKGTNQSINKEERSDEKWDQKTSTMKKDDYKGFAFIQDFACSMNDTRQLYSIG